MDVDCSKIRAETETHLQLGRNLWQDESPDNRSIIPLDSCRGCRKPERITDASINYWGRIVFFFHNVYTLQIAYTNEIWWPIGFHGMFEVWLRFGGARDGWRFWRSESCTDSIRSTKYSWVCQCMISNNLLYNVWFAWSFIWVELNHSFTSDLYM